MCTTPSRTSTKEFSQKHSAKDVYKRQIVRHKLVERIVDAYEKFDKEAKDEREKRKNEQLFINGERPVKQVNN